MEITVSPAGNEDAQHVSNVDKDSAIKCSRDLIFAEILKSVAQVIPCQM